MGFFDADYIALGLAYIAFGYVIAQLANAARMRWENKPKEAVDDTDMERLARQRSIIDYHNSIALFACLNRWFILLLGAALLLILLQGMAHWEFGLLPRPELVPVQVFWILIYMAEIKATDGWLLAAYKEELRGYGLTPRYEHYWPSPGPSRD